MTYSPPYIYNGLYEEESKGFEIIGRSLKELWRETNAEAFKYIAIERERQQTYREAKAHLSASYEGRSFSTATGAIIAAQQSAICRYENVRQMAMRKARRGDGSGALA